MKAKKLGRKGLALLLAAILVATVVPMNAFAVEDLDITSISQEAQTDGTVKATVNVSDTSKVESYSVVPSDGVTQEGSVFTISKNGDYTFSVAGIDEIDRTKIETVCTVKPSISSVSIKDADGNNVNSADTGAGWTSGDATLTITVADNGTDIASCKLGDTDMTLSEGRTYTATISDNASHDVVVTDTISNTFTKSVKANIDTTAPEINSISVTSGGNTCSDSNFYSSATLTVNVTETGSGIKKVVMTDETGESKDDTTAPYSFEITKNHTYTFKAIDKLDQESAESSKTVSNIDYVAPSCTEVKFDPIGWTYNEIRLAIDTPTDTPSAAQTYCATSGIAGYQLDGKGDWKTSVSDFTFSKFEAAALGTGGTHYVRIKDNAGNVSSDYYVGDVQYDNAAPIINSVKLTADGVDDATKTWTNKDVTATVKAHDFGEELGEEVGDNGISEITAYCMIGADEAAPTTKEDTRWNAAISTNLKEYTYTITDNNEHRFFVMDNAGKISEATTETALYDATAPAITIANLNTPTKINGGVGYYDAEQTVTITITDDKAIDLENTKVTYKVAGEETTATLKQLIDDSKKETPAYANWTITVTTEGDETTKCELTYKLVEGEELNSMSFKVSDKAGNGVGEERAIVESNFVMPTYEEAGETKTVTGVIVDATAPTINISTLAAPTQINGGVGYYDAKQTVTIDINDAIAIDTENTKVTYKNTVAGKEVETTLTLKQLIDDSKEATKAYTNWTCKAVTTSGDGYQLTYTITDGERLNSMSFTVVDKTGHGVGEEKAVVESNLVMPTYEEAGETKTVTGIVVDTTAPTITISTLNTPTNTYAGIGYYNAEQTVTVEINDAIAIDLDKTKVTYKNTVAGEAIETTATLKQLIDNTSDYTNWTCTPTAQYGETVKCVLTYTLVDGAELNSMSFTVADKAGNGVGEDKAVVESNLVMPTYKDAAETKTVTGIIADTTQPVVTVNFISDKDTTNTFKDIYYNATTKKVYATFNYMNIFESGSTGKWGTIFNSQTWLADSSIDDKTTTIKFQVSVTDKNINKDGECLVSNIKGDTAVIAGETKINEESTLTYTITKTLTLDAVEDNKIEFDLNIKDLANNTKYVDPVLSSESYDYTITNDKGVIKDTINIDCKRPFSNGDETTTPTVDFTIENFDTKTTVDGVELYSDIPTVKYSVDDSTTGVKNVQWEVFSGNNTAVAIEQKTGTTTDTQGTILSLDPQNHQTVESNDVTIRIAVTDNAGNVIYRTITIAIDNYAPRVTLDYNDVTPRDGHYFKAEREGTLTVTDLNFNEGASTLTTNGTIGQWSDGSKAYSHVVKVYYPGPDQDTDYTFAFSTTDLASYTTAAGYNTTETGNYNLGANDKDCPYQFTVDMVKPVVSVSYDNNSAMNGNYYKANRTATIKITERNFDPADVNIIGTATGDSTTFPSLSSWTTDGNDHYATLSYTNDAKYTFDIEFVDMAGNSIDDYTKEEFTVDKTMPDIDISGVETHTAYRENVIPVVTSMDTNYDQDATITLTGSLNGTVSYAASTSDTSSGNKTGKVVTYQNFAKEKKVDDIYTLSVKVTDKAGNSTEKAVTFSVNRFGSTYDLDMIKDTIIGQYLVTPMPVVITEVNVDPLNPIKIRTIHNGEPTELTENVDYSIDYSGQQWSSESAYTYTIYADNFEADGTYSVVLYTEDTAGNINENIDENEIKFTVDGTDPIITIANFDDGETYDMDSKEVSINIEDNIKLMGVQISVDGKSLKETTDLNEFNNNPTSYLYANGNEYKVMLSESSSKQALSVTAIDMAGNTTIDERSATVTTNIFVLWFNNTPLFIGSLVGLAVVVGGIIFIVNNKKKKKSSTK